MVCGVWSVVCGLCCDVRCRDAVAVLLMLCCRALLYCGVLPCAALRCAAHCCAAVGRRREKGAVWCVVCSLVWCTGVGSVGMGCAVVRLGGVACGVGWGGVGVE